MGLYSWKWADEKGRLMVGGYAYLALPDGTYYYGRYDGYGNIGCIDVYDAVVDWNKDYLIRNVDYLFSGKTSHLGHLSSFVRTCILMMITYDFDEKIVDALLKDTGEFYDCDWKRYIGIYLACEDEDNASLDYPIKICKTNTKDAFKLPASKGDPMQGCN